MSNQLKMPPDMKPQAEMPMDLFAGSLPLLLIHFLISSKHWSMPQLAIVAWPGSIVPSLWAFFRLISIGSRPRSAAIHSICCSEHHMAWGAPKPRIDVEGRVFV